MSQAKVKRELSVAEKKAELEKKLNRKLDRDMPEDQIHDLYQNQFHGPDLPFYYETVVNGKTIAKWKAKEARQ